MRSDQYIKVQLVLSPIPKTERLGGPRSSSLVDNNNLPETKLKYQRFKSRARAEDRRAMLAPDGSDTDDEAQNNLPSIKLIQVLKKMSRARSELNKVNIILFVLFHFFDFSYLKNYTLVLVVQFFSQFIIELLLNIRLHFFFHIKKCSVL